MGTCGEWARVGNGHMWGMGTCGEWAHVGILEEHCKGNDPEIRGCQQSLLTKLTKLSRTYLSKVIPGIELSGIIPLLGFLFQMFQSRIFCPQMFVGMYGEELLVKVLQQSYGLCSPTS